MTLLGYDTWKIDPPEPELWTCPSCGEENCGGDECHDCGAEHEAVCRNGRCGRCGACDEKADRQAEARLEARWDDDPGREVW